MTIPTAVLGVTTPRQRMQRKLIRCECEALGITIARRGQCYSLQGDGVDLIVADLALVAVEELRPHGRAVRRA